MFCILGSTTNSNTNSYWTGPECPDHGTSPRLATDPTAPGNCRWPCGRRRRTPDAAASWGRPRRRGAGVAGGQTSGDSDARSPRPWDVWRSGRTRSGSTRTAPTRAPPPRAFAPIRGRRATSTAGVSHICHAPPGPPAVPPAATRAQRHLRPDGSTRAPRFANFRVPSDSVGRCGCGRCGCGRCGCPFRLKHCKRDTYYSHILYSWKKIFFKPEVLRVQWRPRLGLGSKRFYE